MSTQNATVMKMEDIIDWEKSHYFSFGLQNNKTLNKRPGSVQYGHSEKTCTQMRTSKD